MNDSKTSTNKILPTKLNTRLWIIPPVILTIIAMLQPIAVHRFKLNQWKAGGFGVFSSVDHYSNRFLRITVPTENGEMPALLTSWNKGWLRMICMPNIKLLNEEASSHDSTLWTQIQAGELDASSDLKNPKSAAIKSIVNAYAFRDSSLDSPTKLYPSFLAPAKYAKMDSYKFTATGIPNVRAYRLVYHGQGRFSSALLASSESLNTSK